MEQAFDGFRTQNMAPTMMKPRKKDSSEEMSYLVDQTLRISNLRFLEGLLGIQRFIEALYRKIEFALTDSFSLSASEAPEHWSTMN